MGIARQNQFKALGSGWYRGPCTHLEHHRKLNFDDELLRMLKRHGITPYAVRD